MQFLNQIVVLVRFSHPSTGGYRKTPKAAEKAEAFVYDEDRLERRFRLFEAICLPSLVAQTDPDFAFVVVTGDKMPTPFRDRLHDILKPLNQPYISEVHPGHSYWATRRGFNEVPKDGFTHRTSVRMDDDDGLDNGFIERLKKRVNWLYDPANPRATFAVAHNRGFYLEMREGENNVFDVAERLPLGLGLSLTLPIEFRGNVYRTNHRNIGEQHNVYSDVRTPSFIRTIHPDNDSGLNVNGVSNIWKEARIRTVLDRDFAMSLDALRAL